MDLLEEFRIEDEINRLSLGESKESPIFSLKRLDWDKLSTKVSKHHKSRVIKKVSANNNIIVMATNTSTIIRWHLADGYKSPEEIEIPLKHEDSIENIFLDYTGHHLIISMLSMENFYLHSKSTKPKKLSKLQGIIESIAFDRQQGTETATKSFLAATNQGKIYEIYLEPSGSGSNSSVKERICQLVYQLDSPIPITSIYFDTLGSSNTNASESTPTASSLSTFSTSWPSSNTAKESASSSFDGRYFVMFATSKPTRLYHFIGGPNFQQLFVDYMNNSASSYTEFPGEIKKAELHCYSKTPNTRAQNFVLMTEMGIYHGSLLFTNGSAKDSENVILEVQLIPYQLANNDTKLSRNSGAADDDDGFIPMGTIKEVEDLIRAKSQPIDASAKIALRPLSIAVSSYHFLVLRGDRIQFISNLNGSLVQEELLSSVDGIPLGLIRDSIKNSTWLYTTHSIFQVTSMNEDRNVWSIYLNKALLNGEEKYFETALEFTKVENQKLEIMKSRAEFYQKNGEYEKAALSFAKSPISFDEVILRLTHCLSGANHLDDGGLNKKVGGDSLIHLTYTNGIDEILTTGIQDLTPLRIYLTEKLKLLPSQSKSQKTMLSTWLCEVYLHQIAMSSMKPEQEASSNVLSSNELVEQFKNFLRNYKTSLDISTTLNLMISRNQRALLLFYSQIIGDYHRVISLFLTEKRFVESIQLLNGAPIEKVIHLIYTTSPLLIEQEPDSTVQMLLSKPQLSVSGILPALLRYSKILDDQLEKIARGEHLETKIDEDFEGNKVNFAIRYLKSYLSMNGIDYESEDPSSEPNSIDIMNIEPIAVQTYVWLLVKYDMSVDEDEIFRFLKKLWELKEDGLLMHNNIDYHFIYRLCKSNNKKKSLIFAYLLVGSILDAVRYAVEVDIHQAKTIAKTEKFNHMAKDIWLEIVKYQISTLGDIKGAIQLITESDHAIVIDDLLPILPDFTEIDIFQEEICQSLEKFGENIHDLKLTMAEMSESAETTVKELDSMKNRAYGTISQHQKCEYCSETLLGMQFYLFPCSHGFHTQCLLARVAEHLSPQQISAVCAIEEKLKQFSGKLKLANHRVRTEFEALQNELDGYIAADCPLCGYLMIKSLEVSLISDQDEANKWRL